MDILHHELHKKLEKIEKIFNTSKIISQTFNLKSIAKYYKINKIPYTVFHHGNDFIHMGISRNNSFNNSDLLEHAKLVERYIIKLKAKNVLELATGRGATSAYLALKYPKVLFDAIDLPDGQIDYAINKSKKILNFKPVCGDYHNLRRYKKNSINIVFIIEALCYSANKKIVFKELRRVLKKGGVFIIFDGYSGKKDNKLTSDEMLAKKLTEKGMNVNNFDYYLNLKKNLMSSNFKIIEEEDVSLLIMPTLKKFEKQAKIYFSLPIIMSKLINYILPDEFVNNVLSAYLMPILIKLKIAKYMITVVES